MNDPKRQHSFEHISCRAIESILILQEMVTFDLVMSVMLAFGLGSAETVYLGLTLSSG